MPIRIPDNLPARKTLEHEGVVVMDSTRAARQDIRPLQIGLLNLMPNKERTETQFTRLDAAVAALERARARLNRYRAAVLADGCAGRLSSRRCSTNVQPPMFFGSSCAQTSCFASGYRAKVSRSRVSGNG